MNSPPKRPPEPIVLNISAQGETPYATVKRRLGRINAGLYCTKCTEFFALFVVPDGQEGMKDWVSFQSDGLPLFECPLCGHKQRRAPTEIGYIQLTEKTKRRPAPPSEAH